MGKYDETFNKWAFDYPTKYEHRIINNIFKNKNKNRATWDMAHSLYAYWIIVLSSVVVFFGTYSYMWTVHMLVCLYMGTFPELGIIRLVISSGFWVCFPSLV